MPDDGEPIARIEDYQPDASAHGNTHRAGQNGGSPPTIKLPKIKLRAGDRHLAADDGLKAWREVQERGYEGFVAKDESSPYTGGRTLSFRLPRKQQSATRAFERARGV